jgi:ABC-2 type transport system permease protein
MSAFFLFFRNFLAQAFRHPFAWVLHFVLPIASFLAMYLLLGLTEDSAFAGTQAIGLVVYFGLIQAVLVASLVLRDREEGVARRILVSPAPYAAYLLGNAAASLLVLAGQTLVFSVFICFIARIPVGLGFLPLTGILLVFDATCLGFAFLICALSGNATGAIMTSNVVVLFTSLVGGSFFPVEFMGDTLRKLALACPQYWVMRSIRQVQDGSPLADTVLSLVVLALFGLLFFVVQAVIGRRRMAAS